MHVNRREFLRKSICAALGGAGLYSALGSLRLIGGRSGIAASVRRSPTTRRWSASSLRRQRQLQHARALRQRALSRCTPDRGRAWRSRKADIQANALNPAASGGGRAVRRAMADPMAFIRRCLDIARPVQQRQCRDRRQRRQPSVSDHAGRLPERHACRRPRSCSRTTIRRINGKPRAPDDPNANGWGGRIADLLYSSNAGQVPMSITLSGQNRFQRGAVVNQYTVDSWGASCAASGDPDCGPFSVTDDELSGQRPRVVDASMTTIRTSSPTTPPPTTR